MKIEIELNEKETEALEALTAKTELNNQRVMIHALRLYELYHHGIMVHKDNAAQALKAIVDITKEIYGDDPTICTSYDPEYPAETWLVLNVKNPVTTSIKDCLSLESKWVKKANALDIKYDIRLKAS